MVRRLLRRWARWILADEIGEHIARTKARTCEIVADRVEAVAKNLPGAGSHQTVCALADKIRRGQIHPPVQVLLRAGDSRSSNDWARSRAEDARPQETEGGE